jgi:hypothetical protein
MIETAERPAPGRPTEDRIFVLPNAVVLLDGVTSTRPPTRNGAWYAQTLGTELATLLATPANLGDLLATAIDRIAQRHALIPGDSPASTVAITRWTADTVDVLVLADSPVVVFTPEPKVIADTRLVDLRPVASPITDWTNREGGYWVAEAVPEAGHQAVQASFPRSEVENVIMTTDGVSCGVDDYGIFPNWQAVLDIATTRGVEAVLDDVRKAELSDPERTRWPRFKIHDDQALAVIRGITSSFSPFSASRQF